MKKFTQDEFLVKVLAEIQKDVLENYNIVKNSADEDDKEIAEDFKEVLDELEPLLPKIHNLDELAQMDEETLGFIYECLVTYESVFIVSYLTKEDFEQSEYEHNLLTSIIDLFED